MVSILGLLIKYPYHDTSPEDCKGWKQEILTWVSPQALVPQFFPSYRNSRVSSATGIAGHSEQSSCEVAMLASSLRDSTLGHFSYAMVLAFL